MLGCSEYLNTFFSEICVETGEREPRSVNGGLANFPMKPNARALEFHLQFFRVTVVKGLNGDNRDALLLIT